MPWVQVFLSPTASGEQAVPGEEPLPAVHAALVADIRALLAERLRCSPHDVLVQLFFATHGSSPMAVAVVRGRSRAGMDGALYALRSFLAERLALELALVLTCFEDPSRGEE